MNSTRTIGSRESTSGKRDLLNCISFVFFAKETLVHGDLTENVLLSEGQPPAVIDFSPYWRPVGFANAVCWGNAAPETFCPAVSAIEPFPQLLVWALIFWIVTSLAFSESEPDLGGYTPGIEMALGLVR